MKGNILECSHCKEQSISYNNEPKYCGIDIYGHPKTLMVKVASFKYSPKKEPVNQKRFLCKLGIHKSDRDFGMHWATRIIISKCKHCTKQISHPLITMINE